MTAPLNKALDALNFYIEAAFEHGNKGLSDSIDPDGDILHAQREAHAELKAYIEGHVMIKIEDVPDLEATLMNAVKPQYDFYATCGKCGEFETNNGEWLIWCGPESCAQKLIDTTTLLHKAIKEHKEKHNGNT